MVKEKRFSRQIALQNYVKYKVTAQFIHPPAAGTHPQDVVVSLQLFAQSLQFAASGDAAATVGLQLLPLVEQDGQPLLQDAQLPVITAPQGGLHTHKHTLSQL